MGLAAILEFEAADVRLDIVVRSRNLGAEEVATPALLRTEAGQASATKFAEGVGNAKGLWSWQLGRS